MFESHLSLASLCFLTCVPLVRSHVSDNPTVHGGNAVTHSAIRGVIRGTVFYDIDEDGLYNPSVPGEVPLPGWKVEIDSGNVVVTRFTDRNGGYAFLLDVDSLTYVVTSIAPPAAPGGPPGYVGVPGGNWLATGVECQPMSVCTALSNAQVSVVASEDEIIVNFGDVFLGSSPQLARSKGHWHNQGQADLSACDPLWRTAINDLCLRQNFTNPNPAQQATTIFTVSEGTPFSTAFSELSGYLVGNRANGVLAFILSAQFCAANLNVACGPLQGKTVYIDRLQNTVLVPLTEMIANTRALLCDPRSANTGPGGNAAWNAVLMGCLMEWDDMNSNGVTIFTKLSGPGPIISPY